MSKNVVSPMSIIEIQNIALFVRRLLNSSRIERLNMAKAFDELSIILEHTGIGFNYEIKPDNDKIFKSNEEALTDLKTGTIYIKNSVMEEACTKKHSRATFTLAHELGHYFLHYLPIKTTLARVADDEKVPVFMDPEWQANTFASELLMPEETCVHMSIEGIMNIYNVSKQAAKVRWCKLNGVSIYSDNDIFY